MSKILTVRMPDIGEGVVEGEVVEWLKHLADDVKQDEPVVVVMTDKATVELPAPMPGKLSKMYFQPGQIAVKDQPLYDIEIPGEDVVSQDVKVEKENAATIRKASPVCSHSLRKNISEGKVQATPPVRNIAKQMGIDLQSVKGTGKDGRISIDDLKKTFTRISKDISESPAGLEGDEEKPLIGVRRLMAEKMKASKIHIPHFSYFEKTDATRLVALRDKLKGQAVDEDIHITYMPLFIRALSMCIKKHPEMNSSFDEKNNKIIIRHLQHIGIAVAGQQGLVVAVLHDVQNMNLDQIIHNYDALKKRSNAGQLLPADMKNSTITISNFGVLGGNGLWATPIINYPEAAIVAVDKIHKQPTVVNGEVVVRDMLNVSWSFDHRFLDGEKAAVISRDFCALIRDPASLL